MLQTLIIFFHYRNIILLRSLENNVKSIFRRKSVIRQIETSKLSRAEKIKKQNFDTAQLFGPRVVKKTTQSATAVTRKAKPEQQPRESGVDSEIYWTLPNNVKTSTAPTKTRKKKKGALENVERSEIDKGLELVAKEVPIILKKSIEYNYKRDEKLPDTFSRFKLDMPKPVKVTIQDALDSLDSRINYGDKSTREIPFDENQLRKMIEFPLIPQDNNDLVLNIFDKSVIMNRKINFTPSVSKILQATMSVNQKNALIQWKSLKIAELGLEGFEAMQKEYLDRGKLFHQCLQSYFNNSEINDDHVPSSIKDLWESISTTLKEFELPAIATEQAIFHPHLRYKGIVDCVSVHHQSKSLSVIEWKNSDRHKKSILNTFDAPLQMCAYLAALNASSQFKNQPLTSGIIVVAYNDGKSADLFHLTSDELNKYWRLWLNRLQEYWTRYRDDTLADDEF